MFDIMKHKKLLSVLLVIVAVLLMAFHVVNAAEEPTSDELKSQLESLEKEKNAITGMLKDLQNQYTSNRNELSAMVAEKENIDQQIFLLHEQIVNTEAQIATYRLLIAEKQVELEEAQARLHELNEIHKDRIRTMEEDGRMTYWSVLFKANSFADLLDRLNMMQEIAAADQRRLQEMSAAAAAVAEAQASLETEKTALETTKAELDTMQVQLAEKRAEADKLLADDCGKTPSQVQNARPENMCRWLHGCGQAAPVRDRSSRPASRLP
jgi:peptidoglycan hydrolase CwlO-like protein